LSYAAMPFWECKDTAPTLFLQNIFSVILDGA